MQFVPDTAVLQSEMSRQFNQLVDNKGKGQEKNIVEKKKKDQMEQESQAEDGDDDDEEGEDEEEEEEESEESEASIEEAGKEKAQEGEDDEEEESEDESGTPENKKITHTPQKLAKQLGVQLQIKSGSIKRKAVTSLEESPP